MWEDDFLTWACRCVPAGAVGVVTSSISEATSCAGTYCVRFPSCAVVVAKSRCVLCTGACTLAEAVSSKIVESLRGPTEQRVALRAVGHLLAAALDGKESDDMALAAMVFVATEPLTAGGPTWAYAFCGRGAMAAFQADAAQRVFLDVVARTDRSPSSGSPAGSSPASSAGSPASASPHGSANGPLPTDLLRTSNGPEEPCFGACTPGQLFALVAEPGATGRQHSGSINKGSSGQISKAIVTGTIWKRASVAGTVSLQGETGRTTVKMALADSAEWTLQGAAMEQALMAGMRQRRPDAFVAAFCAPGERNSGPGAGGGAVAALDGTLFGEHEHAPLGVLILHAPSRATMTLFVRTIPFGSLECTPSENHVSMYLSRREDQLGQSHATKWDKNVRRTTDELSGSNFVRVVLLPCKVDPLSQSIKILENGIVRIDYQTREVQVTPQHHMQQQSSQGGTTPKRGIGSVKRSIFAKKKE